MPSIHEDPVTHCPHRPALYNTEGAPNEPGRSAVEPTIDMAMTAEDAAELQSLLSELGIKDLPSTRTAVEATDDHGIAHNAPSLDTAGPKAERAGAAPETVRAPLSPIYVEPGRLRATLIESERVLAESGQYFRRGGRIVRVQVDRTAGVHSFQEVTAQGALIALAELSTWYRHDEKSGGWKEIDPCAKTCRLLVESWPCTQLPVLTGIARQPHLREDGSMCLTPGYDPQTGLLGTFSALRHDIPVHPTRQDALGALALLDDLLSECAFAGPEDRSAALSALLTAAVRPSIALAPMFHVMAHQPGSGKSYLCQLITAIATDAQATPVAFPRTNDACDKLLLAQLLKAPAVIEFDNLTTDLKPLDKLCTMLTAERIEGRQLGASRTLTVPTRTLVLSSGNNVRPVDDMVRRTIPIHLDPGMETPATRVFKRPNLLNDVQADRLKYVAAALTIVRAWLLAQPPKIGCASLAGYVEWSAWCRQPLLWLDQVDPATRVFQGLKNDPAQLLLGRVMQGWIEKHGSSPKLVRDVVKTARSTEEGDFYEALVDATGGTEPINVRRLGHWLSRNEGKVVGSNRLCRAPKTRNVESWHVLESVPSVLDSTFA